MADKDLKEHVEEADEVEDFTKALERFRQEFQNLEERVERLEEDKKTKVRVVDTERGKRIVLENRNQTWFSPNYFRKILERIDQGEHDEGAEGPDEDRVL